MEFDALPGRAGRLYLMATKANNGKIDLTKPTFSQNKDNFTKGNAGVHATKKGADKRVQKLIDKGAAPELFEEIETNYQKAKDALETKTSSVEGVKELMIESIKADTVMNIFPSSIKKPDGKIEKIGPSEKRPIVQQLKEQIAIDNDVLENYIQSTTAQSKGAQLSKELLYKTFGANGREGTLDASKLTPENFKKFGQELSSALSQEAASQMMTRNSPDTVQKENTATKTTGKHASALTKENSGEVKKEAQPKQQSTKRQSISNIASKIRQNLQQKFSSMAARKTAAPPMSKQTMEQQKNSDKGQGR